MGWKQSEAIVEITTAEGAESSWGKQQADQRASRETLGSDRHQGDMETVTQPVDGTEHPSEGRGGPRLTLLADLQVL